MKVLLKSNKQIVNPPYSIGNKIISEAIKHLTDDGTAAVLMPHYCFTSSLYKYAKQAERADPRMFEDAAITEELLVCTLGNKVVNNDKDFLREQVIWDKKWLNWYAYNKRHYAESVDFQFKVIKATPEEGYTYVESLGIDNCIFIHRRQTHGLNTTEDNYSYKLNAGLSKIRDVPFTGNNKNKDGSYKDYMWALSVIVCKDAKSRNNMLCWMNNSKIIGEVIAGLHTNGTIKYALPQVNWNTISDTSLWKQGKYDAAILEEMNR